MILSIAWKNIWRNKVRSLILINTIGFALAGTIFILALMNGWIKDYNIKVIETELTHLQIHNPNFAYNFKLKDTISHGSKVLNEIKNLNFTTKVSGRVKVLGITSSVYATKGAIIIGIDEKKNQEATKVYKYLIDSTSKWLDQTKKQNIIIIGDKLAQDLQMVRYQITDNSIRKLEEIGLPKNILLKLDSIKNKRFNTSIKFYLALEKILSKKEFSQYSDIIATFSITYKIGRKIIIRLQDINGNLVEEAFRIIGVYNTENDLFDGTTLFVKKSYLTQILNLPPNTINEIVIMVDNNKKVEEFKQILKEKYPHLLVESMFDLNQIMKMMTNFIWIYYAIFEIFILFALAFGIVNTMLMAVMERTKELGMLMAIGMNKKRVFFMIMNESVLLTLSGGILGIILGYLITLYTGHTGINLSKYAQEGMEALGFSSIIYPHASLILIIETTILVFLTGVISAIYPAIKALKLKPAKALRTDI